MVTKKICSGCSLSKVIWKSDGRNKYCKVCWSKFQPPKAIRKVAVGRVAKDRIYSSLRAIFLSSKPRCECQLPGCTHEATEVHHKKGRGKYYLDVSTWLACCRTCHSWLTTHSQKAMQLGFSERRNT